MSLVGLLVVLLLAALVLYVIQLLPLDPPVKRILQIVVGVLIILWLLGQMEVVTLGPLRVR